MIIHQPELLTQDGHTVVHARIEMEKPRENFPYHLWYRVPERYEQHLSLQSDAFLIPGLLAGMYFKEEIEVRGTVSPKLAYHLDEYQNLLHFLLPKDVTPVAINYAQLKPLQAKPESVGTTFSGGVDSFFTILKHLPENQPIPEFRITHALFLLGFDILMTDKPKYQTLYNRYREVLKQVNVELIPLETNLVRMISTRMIFPRFYGPILIGSAHLFGNLFNKYFIPNSHDYWQNLSLTSSSNPTSDPLLSSETLDIIHHGAATRRVEKVEAICNWELAQTTLRVCATKEPSRDMMNCSRCEKCVRTMIPLYALGKLDKFTTFKKPFKSDHEFLWWARKFNPKGYYVVEMFPFMRRVRPDLMTWLRIAAMAGYVRYWLLQITPNFARRWLRRFGFFLDDPRGEISAYEDPVLVEFLRKKQA